MPNLAQLTDTYYTDPVPAELPVEQPYLGVPADPDGLRRVYISKPDVYEQGNIDLNARPIVRNADGTISTVKSKSFNFDGKEILLPTVSDDGKLLNDKEAIDLFKKTKKHLGEFKTPEEATAYAEKLHNDQDKLYSNRQEPRPEPGIEENPLEVWAKKKAEGASLWDNLGMAGVEDKSGKSENKLLKKLFGLGGEERYQLWPEKVLREGLAGAGEVMDKGTNLGLRREDYTDIPAPDMPTKDSTWLGKKLNIAPVAWSPQDKIIEDAQAMSALAGSGGLAGTGKEAGMALGVVPVDVAKKLNFKTGKPNDTLMKAVENTPAATIDADGHLIVKLSRNQHPDQEMAESVRGGVFYLPEGSKNGRYYNGTTNNTYGGKQTIEGETAFVNPLVVKGATGGKAPEVAYNQIKGKDAFKLLEEEIRNITTADIYKKEAPWMKQELTQKFLEKHAPELTNHADYILQNSTKGNQLRYALQEAAVASAARNAGYDGVVGYSVGRGVNKDKPFLSEVFDVRENRYPGKDGDYSVHPELYSDSKVATGVEAARRAFLRPALRYKDKLYKGKEGQQHLDVIPENLYGDFQKKAMSGEDISHYNFGFVNDKGQFLTRDKALEYAINTGLIDKQAGQYGALTSTLMADSSKPGTAIEAVAKANDYFKAYHGSNKTDINEFRTRHKERGWVKPAFFAIDEGALPGRAENFAGSFKPDKGGAVYEVNLNKKDVLDTRKPEDLIKLKEALDAHTNEGAEAFLWRTKFKDGDLPTWSDDKLFDALDKAGHKGVLLRERPSVISAAIFDPKHIQIKNKVLFADSSKPGVAIESLAKRNDLVQNGIPALRHESGEIIRGARGLFSNGYMLVPVQGNPFTGNEK